MSFDGFPPMMGQLSPATKTYSAEEALKFAKENTARQWSIGPDSARGRLASGERMSVIHRPKFKISKNEAVFTIGSCFAREIEIALQGHQVPLLLAGHGVIAEKYDSWREDKQIGGGVPAGKISRGVFHKYTTHSMFFDVHRAFYGNTVPDEGLLELAENKWFDPHAAGLALTSKDEALKNRAAVDAGMNEVNHADVVIMTLGLTESWREKKNGLIINRAPTGNFLKKRSDLFEFIDFGYEDVVTVLKHLVEMIASKRNNKVKIIVTVSPVPSSTFTNKDVVPASIGSKSTLRVAAETVSRTYDYVDYFPSYELVTLSPRQLAWNEDAVHVQMDMVKKITNTFIDAYYD